VIHDGEGGFFGAGDEVASGTHTGRATGFARAGANEFARFVDEQIVSTEERLGEADSPGIGVVKVQVGFEEFFLTGDPGIRATRFHFGQVESFALTRRWWPFADGGAKIAAVAHQQQRGDGFHGVKQTEHSGLAFADGVRKRFQKRAVESQPIGSGVHFVFGEFQSAGTDVFVGEEFYFFEADDLGADENIAVGMRVDGWRLGKRLGGAYVEVLRFAQDDSVLLIEG
jgi:hypothetical protein